MKKVLLILIFLGLFINTAYAADCGGAIQCNCGDILTENQVMWYDISGCNETGITIGNDSITLYCNGHTIEGDYNNNAKGILSNGNDYVSIYGCNVTGFDYGIYAGTATNASIRYNNVSNNENGIWVQYLEDSIIQGNIVNSNDIYGLFLSQSTGERVYDNYVHANGYGIRLYDSNENTFFRNDVVENGRGIQVDNGDYNMFYENTLADNAVFNAIEIAAINTTSWNNSQTGNSWDDFETNPGYPNYYEISGPGTGIDYLPIVTYMIPDPVLSYVLLTDESAPGIVTCPAGDGAEYQYLVVGIRDANNDPISGITPEEFDFEVSSSDDYYGNLTFTFRAVENMTDANGEIRFGIVSDTTLQGDGMIHVTASDVDLEDFGTISARTYDLNFDGSVSLADLAIFATHYHTTDWESDYNWDGNVSLPDFGMFAVHYGHSWMGAKTKEIPKNFLKKF
jgi:parallel beta-helix repeat protein